MFESFDYNRDGIIDSFGLSDTLRHYECVVFFFCHRCAPYLNSCDSLEVGSRVINLLLQIFGTLQASLTCTTVIGNTLQGRILATTARRSSNWMVLFVPAFMCDKCLTYTPAAEQA